MKALLWLSCIVVMMLAPVLAPAASVSGQSMEDVCLYPSPHERFGFNVGGNENGGIDAFDVAPLHAGVYMNWSPGLYAPHPNGMGFLPLIGVDEFRPDWQPAGYWPTGALLRTAVTRNLGATWLVGSEVEYRSGHEHATPQGYARIYHDVYHAIKAIDPTARIAINGFATMTPLRLAWLEQAWETYRSLYGAEMPVDVWNYHGYVVNEMVHEWGPDLPSGILNAVGYGAGEWQRVDDPEASRGSYHMSRDAGARGYFAFEGDAVSVFLRTGPDGGMADISIDTQLVQTIDLYSPEPGGFTLTFDALPPSSDPVLGRRHHVRIDVNGSQNPAASDNWVRLDAAMAESTAELPGGRLEDDSPLRATIIAHPDEYEDTARMLGQIRLIRQWMADHGQRDKPLLNTEYGVLLSESAGYDYPRVRRFMLSTFDLFYHSPEIIDPAIGMPADGGRMLQQWLWFILSSWERYSTQTYTSLMSPVDRQMLPLGEVYGSYVRDLVSQYSDLEAADLQITAHWALFSGEASTLRAAGRIRNLGNQETAPFQVRLTSTGVPAQQWEAPGLSPQYSGNDTMTVDHAWQVTATGALTVSLTADSAGQVNEPCEPNNTLAVTLAAAAAPDLAVTNLTMTPPVPTGAATTLRLTAEVANLTSFGAADDQIVVRFWDGVPEASGVLLDTQVITRGVNANVTPVIFDWQGFASGEHTVVVEVAAAAEETNLANNRRQTDFFVPYGQRFNYIPRVHRS